MPKKISESTETPSVTDPRLLFHQSTQPQSSQLTQDLNRLLQQTAYARPIAEIMHMLSHCSDDTGRYVQLLPEFHYFPVLMGSDNRPIPLYYLVEAIDEFLDYDRLREEFPTLSIAQIEGAISFLRRVAQYNTGNIDPDLIEDEELMRDESLLNELREALADEGTARVLHFD